MKKKKTGVKEILRKDIKNYFDKISIQIKEVINARHKYIIGELKKLCSDHIRKYGDDVELIIQTHREQETISSKKIKTIHKDINYLEDCEENVNSQLVELKYS